MSPGIHSLKIHESGEVDYDCMSVGDVFNPFGSNHGESTDDIHQRRVGDIEQIQTTFDHKAEYRQRDSLVTLSNLL